ncbi:MAG: penicillin-binding protein activator [Burkholderiaceae bacterium]|nr:penicillin-binding protein activator [Burkholderiaceae bacterium]
MNTRLIVRYVSSAILASLSLCATAQVPFGANAQNSLTIALLLPSSDSAFAQVAQAMSNGVIAANSTSKTPARILLLPRKQGQTALSHLQDAALSGASVAIGPITRDEVDQVAQLDFLPLPVVSLNLPYNDVVAPELLMSYSLSQEEEARDIVKIGIGALPEIDSKGETPKVAIFETKAPLETRIGNIFAEELEKAQVPFERIVLTPELLAQQKLYEEQIDPNDDMPELEELPDPVEDPYGYQRIRLKNKRLMQEYKAQQAFKEPPFYAAFLAMDARTAALVRPRLPRLTRVWGTSLLNPGDPTQSTAASLTYDMQHVGIVEAPLVLHNNKEDFLERFSMEMPTTLLERRLFAFGVDAYRLADHWAHWSPTIQFAGMTGHLSFDHNGSPVVERHAQPAEILSNKIRARSVEQLQKPLVSPEVLEEIRKAAQAQRQNQETETTENQDASSEETTNETAVSASSQETATDTNVKTSIEATVNKPAEASNNETSVQITVEKAPVNAQGNIQ